MSSVFPLQQPRCAGATVRRRSSLRRGGDAKKAEAGDTLDGEGGYAVYGKIMRAEDSLARRGLPLGLAHGIKLNRPVAQGAPVSWDDVAIEENDVVRLRREMERAFAPKGARKPVAA